MASASLLITHAILYFCNISRRNIAEEACSTFVPANEETHSNRFVRKINHHAHNHGGPIIFGFKIARLIGCITLFSLSLAALLDVGQPIHQELFLDHLPQIAMPVTFVSLIITKFLYVLTRPTRTVPQFRPCYNVSHLQQLQPICHTS